MSFFFFFFNDTATTEIYTLSLHDALPIWSTGDSLSAECFRSAPQPLWRHRRSQEWRLRPAQPIEAGDARGIAGIAPGADRKSTRLNSSHANISYAVFCLKKKKNNNISTIL